MRIEDLEYHAPVTVEEACELLHSLAGETRILAGGTDVLSRQCGGKNGGEGKHLIDITQLGVGYIKSGKDCIHIGAAATINSIGASALFSTQPNRVLSEAVACHSTHTIRNRATIGGNLCNASPCADLAPPLLALDARLVVTGPGMMR